MDVIRKNFECLVGVLEKYYLNSGIHKSKIRKSKKYNAFIITNNWFLRREYVLGPELISLEKKMDNLEIDYQTFSNEYKKYRKEHPLLMDKSTHSFKLFVYLENDKFCVDIQENGVLTKLVEVDVPDKIIGGHNGETALVFGRCINEQIIKYMGQERTNIEIIRNL